MRDWVIAVLWCRFEWFVLLAIYVTENGPKPVANWVFVNTPLGFCLRLDALRRGDFPMARRITEILNAAGR